MLSVFWTTKSRRRSKNQLKTRNELPVWQCTSRDCDFKWATDLVEQQCPACHMSTVQLAGYNYAEVIEASEKHDYDKYGDIHVPNPVPDLVALTEIDQEHWVGLPVFHPLVDSWIMYDVGIIIDVYQDPDFSDMQRCCFQTSDCSTLVYPPDRLWIPEKLAICLRKGGERRT